MQARYLLLVFMLVVTTFTVSARKRKKANATIPKDQIAFNTLKFGASAVEYHKLYADSVQQIGEYRYTLHPVFQNDKLVSLNITTPREDAHDFKTNGLVEINALVTHFTGSFGPPLYQWYVPALTSFDTYQKGKISNWQIGSKVIDIYVTRCTAEFYQGVCTITNNPAVAAALSKQQ
jgi:hypothetical protein